MWVIAKEDGFFDGVYYRKGTKFFVPDPSKAPKWAEPVNEPVADEKPARRVRS